MFDQIDWTVQLLWNNPPLVSFFYVIVFKVAQTTNIAVKHHFEIFWIALPREISK